MNIIVSIRKLNPLTRDFSLFEVKLSVQGRKVCIIDSCGVPEEQVKRNLIGNTVMTEYESNGEESPCFFYQNLAGDLMLCPTWAIPKDCLRPLKEIYRNPENQIDLKDAIYLTRL